MDAFNLLFANCENGVLEWKESFCRGLFVDVLSNEGIKRFLPTVDQQIESWQLGISDIFKSQEDKDRLLSCVSTGISALCIFLQANWTGPEVQLSDPIVYLEDEKLNSACSKALQCNGEDVYSLSKLPCLLLVAKTILLDNWQHLKLSFLNAAALIWCMRCIQTYQSVLDEATPILHSVFKELLNHSKELVIADVLPGFLAPLFHLESAHVHLQYFESEKANVHVQNAIKLLKMEVNLSAALGKRTRFQQTAKPQLFLDVEVEDDNSIDANKVVADNMPKDLALDNDTLLPSVAFTDEISQPKTLSVSQQAAVLTLCVLCLKKQAKDELLNEEVAPYLDYVLHQPKDWSIQSQALFLRSVNEKDKSRKVERSMMQIECLLDDRRASTPEVWHRLQTLHASNLPATWEVERAFCQILISLGSIKTALEVYLRIHAWEDVIHCYQALGRTEKAENVIRSQIEIEGTPKLWCLLGDVTQDISHYETAWDVSGHRSARAQRSLGLHYLRKRKFVECIPYLSKSVQINTLQPSIWFSLGCSQMCVGELALAATSFQRCVTMSTENAEAWSNLGSVLLRLDKKTHSYRAFQEASHIAYDNARIWQNLLIVSVDLEEFHEAIRVFNRLLDLTPKEVDTKALKALVYRFENRLTSLDQVTIKSIASKIFTFFGKLTSQITSNHAVWRLFSHLYLFDIEQRDSAKALHYMIKAQNCAVQHTDWKHDADQTKEAVDISSELLRIVKSQASSQQDDGRKIQIISSPLTNIENFLIQLKNHNVVKPELESNNEDLKAKIKQLQTDSEDLKQTLKLL